MEREGNSKWFARPISDDHFAIQILQHGLVINHDSHVPAFQTAVAFADYRYFLLTAEEKQAVGNRACLEAQDFAKVSEMTLAFKNYLKSIKRDEETVAKVGGYR